MRIACKVLAVVALTLAAGLAVQGKDKGRIPMPNAHESVNQYLAYPYRTAEPPAQTAAPKGYVPFHMEHYGRHGSRFMCQAIEYDQPVEILRKAHDLGKLTPEGEKIYAHAARVADAARNRAGDLTEVGALEHQAIGRRMARNYPQIFAPGTHVDARSSIVIRCILSMLNELNELKAAQPGLRVTSDASLADMWYTVPGYTQEAQRLRDSINTHCLPAYREKYLNKGQYLKVLFNDPVYAADSVPCQLLAERLIALLGGAQNHLDQEWLLEEVFTPQELVDQWHMMNAFWFIEAGNSPMSHGLAPLQRDATLRNMIESADTAMTSPSLSANLRFGHDGIVLPLAVMMELDDAGAEFYSLDDLDGRLHDYRIIPMGCNIQMVFYRPEGSLSPDDVLVKVLLNEKEARLPVAPSKAGEPYYPWPILRKYYLDKLDGYAASAKP